MKLFLLKIGVAWKVGMFVLATPTTALALPPEIETGGILPSAQAVCVSV